MTWYIRKSVNLDLEHPLVQIPALLLTRIVALSKCPNSSESQFSYLQNRIKI